MANSRYEYTRKFEIDDTLLPNTWIVIRIDGRGFHKLSSKYAFRKPNDRRALDLMNAAARAVLHEIPDLVLAYGQSDEYSFVFRKSTKFFGRRASKLSTTIVSVFTAHYILNWPLVFPDQKLSPPLPSFDGRAIVYPSEENLRDYLSWRQVDCKWSLPSRGCMRTDWSKGHINNLYNTTFWALVQRGAYTEKLATEELKHTFSSDKNDILFSRFGINYNNEPDCYKRGTTIIRNDRDIGNEPQQSSQTTESNTNERVPTTDSDTTIDNKDADLHLSKPPADPHQQDSTIILHVDIIKDTFWLQRPSILAEPRTSKEKNKVSARTA